MGLVALLGIHHTSQAADHADANSLLTQSMADINDVYTWMTTDGAKVNLAMTFAPFDNLVPANMTRHLGPTVVYAFHITSRPGFAMAGTEKKVICKFTDDTHGECWLTDSANKTVDYVAGDLSGDNGRISASGKFRVFAGRRSDPFFFNLGGVKKAVADAETDCGGSCPPPVAAALDAAGCVKALTGTQANILRADVGGPVTADNALTPFCDESVTGADCFAAANVFAIVVQVDKDELLSGTDKIVSVWASTHAGS